ncbi:MAG: response regulator transcription factor [Dehalococcoidales bacterium]|nr:response regulator transcription factor [Dehalococcoidales bacterium]
MEKIRVFLSDQQVLFREGIHFILSGEDDFEVTGETTSNEEAYSFIQANPPNIAILSMHDVKTDGAEITRHIRRNVPSVSVILITDKKEPEKLFSAIKCGASACLTKDTEPEHLLDIIRVVTQGSLPIIEELLTPAIASLVLNEFEDLDTINKQFDDLLANITPKEKQVLNAVATNGEMEQLTSKLDMSEDTIRHSLRLILNKLVSNEQARNIIDVAQRSLPSIIRTGHGNGKTTEYVTKAEFNEFKDSLMERLKSFIGELT